MQIKIKSPITFNDKNIISLSEKAGYLEVYIGEKVENESHVLIKAVFTDVLGFVGTVNSSVQALVTETEENDFMKNTLKANYESGQAGDVGKIPANHGYKRFVFYSYEDQHSNYSDPSLEVIAKDVRIEAIN